MTSQSNSDWLALAAEVLECEDLGPRAGTTSFTMLGGTSLRAMAFSARMARHHGRAIDIGALLGPRSLADVVAATPRLPPTPAAESAAGPAVGSVELRRVAGAEARAPRPLARVQQAMLFSEQLHGGTAFHLLFSAYLRGPIDPARLTAALERLTRRHASLRTVFRRSEAGDLTRAVLVRWDPVVIEQSLPAVEGDPVDAVHALLQPATATLLRPFDQPPVVFILSLIDDERAVLTLVIHHAVADGWSIGLLWRELAAEYAGADAGAEVGADESEQPSLEPLIAAESGEAVRRAAAQRADDLRNLPSIVGIPSDLDRPTRLSRAGTRLAFGLTDDARRGCEALASATGLTRNMVLLAAWALVIARRAALPELVMGMVSAGRATDESLRVVGPCMKLLPVACRVGDGSTVDYLRATAASVRAALAAADVPLEDIVAALGLGGDDSRNPLVQVAFAAHDELVPDRLRAGGLEWELREGHCGGTVYDAVLYVQRWGERPRLALEYATAVLRSDEAAELATAMNHTLLELVAAADRPVHEVRTMTDRQRDRLRAWGDGPTVDAGTGLWQLVEAAATRSPDRVAVRDSDPARTLTYRQLVRAAEVQSGALAVVGVAAGDCVALAVPRSDREIVAILAILRLGASYTAVEPDQPEAAVRAMFDVVGVRVVLGAPERLQALAALRHGRPSLSILDPAEAAASVRRTPDAAPADPERVAYVAFTSGSSGTPKGANVPHRGVVRLVRDARYLRPGTCDRFVRLAPLAFDASTLEIFAPLTAGGTVEVYADEYVTPDGLADFLSQRRITGLWLTAGLFRLVADYRPGAFRGVRQVLTGGDVVPPAQVARVLREAPLLRITNGYGPTENTTFTTVHHIDEAAAVDDPLPIGRPIQGTGVLVLDATGHLVPPGGLGELYTYGDGLAHGYAGQPETTARAFGAFAAGDDRRLYRTGDLVRWDSRGRLRFLGRGDHQVKIRGFRVELDLVARVLREHPRVRDAAVVATGSVAADRRLLAGLVASDHQGLVEPAFIESAFIESVRAFAAERLPGYALPSLWAVVADLPVTRNGKVDAARLREVAVTPRAAASAEAPAPVSADPDLTRSIARVWQEVLGFDQFGVDQRFFDIGGDSLQLLRVAASLRRDLPGYDITIQDLYASQTIRQLSARLVTRIDGRSRS